MHAVSYHALALQEFEDAVQYYLNISPDLADRFVDAFEASLKLIRENPKACARIHKDIRRRNLDRFPYALIFKLISERIFVIACTHARRDPGHWKSRR